MRVHTGTAGCAVLEIRPLPFLQHLICHEPELPLLLALAYSYRPATRKATAPDMNLNRFHQNRNSDKAILSAVLYAFLLS